jgi:YHS domain-containing protein
LVWHDESDLPMLAGGSLIIGSGLLIALAARNTQVALRPTSPVDEAYARFSSCQSAAPLARPDRGFRGLILETLLNPKSMSALGCRRPFVIDADGAERHRSNCANKPTIKTMQQAEVHDPVCGMKVDPSKSAASLNHEGVTVYFCSQSCAAKFRASPEKYLKAKPDAIPSHSPANTEPQREYICPMHPEIKQPGPGSCPKCGMALEPREVTAEDSNPELAAMTKRLWISVALAVPMLALMVSAFLPAMPMQHLFSARVWAWIEFALATPVVLWCGLPFFVRGWQSVVHRSLNMFTLAQWAWRSEHTE